MGFQFTNLSVNTVTLNNSDLQLHEIFWKNISASYNQFLNVFIVFLKINMAVSSKVCRALKIICFFLESNFFALFVIFVFLFNISFSSNKFLLFFQNSNPFLIFKRCVSFLKILTILLRFTYTSFSMTQSFFFKQSSVIFIASLMQNDPPSISINI